MLMRYLTGALIAATMLAAPAAFAGSGQTKTNAAVKAAAKQASARQAFGAAPASGATTSAEGTAIARPQAQPGAW
ncbi:hypothetical protein JQ554_01045 [Bradyrhizobium diazoefficiens]|jgi:hypothetical protein|nr:hypothetical protein [Bradyrhizobium diazoefficiens]MBR0962648.1 hypothetical protein [Bradyrhizobium diazoefficiens]MBR0976808.1 hypothetical protein [Bradyrhizobium diazoefficiens]MBR1005453.1 hypothetical protein [Bradyrhizobium diazoefficiens]MBR1011926.1 hypothetical protein [Bradyrhizobium diazoefficiens]MBR1049267.1 hypothetical protein [Bradyrhizobium diazoefficiens]